MADRLEGSKQLNEVGFQTAIDSFPHRDNNDKITALADAHALDLEALVGGSPSGAEVVAARGDEADLDTRITKADEIQGDGVFESVLNDFLVKESSTPDDKVDVDTGEALIDGKMVRTSSVQVVDPPNFSATAKERIDVVQINSSGTVSTTTGAEVALGSGLAEIERPPDNTVVLAYLFLRGQAGSPFAPEDIKTLPNSADSFTIPNLQRFFVQRDRTDAHRHPANLVRNGAFLRIDQAAAVLSWTANGTGSALIQDASDFRFGNFAGKFTGGGGGSGSNFIDQVLLSPESLRGKFVTVSCYMKLSGVTNKTGKIRIEQTGDTPASDFEQTVVLNDEEWQRVHVVGFIDNSVTAISLQIFGDTTADNSTVVLIDGVHLSVGRILTEFEYPEKIVFGDDGTLIEDFGFEADLSWQFPPPFEVFRNMRLTTRT